MFKFFSKIFRKKSNKVATYVSECTCTCGDCCEETTDDVSVEDEPTEVLEDSNVEEVADDKSEITEITEACDKVEYYTFAEACKILGKSDKVVRKMLANGEISGEKVSGKWRITL